MLDDDMLRRLMEAASDSDKKALAEMMSCMGERDVAYFKGYLAGYHDATVHFAMAERDAETGDGGRRQP